MRFPVSALALAGAAILAALPQALAQTVHEGDTTRFAVTKMVDDLDYPWGFDFLPDGSLLVNEIDGRMWWVSADRAERVEVTGVPEVRASGQGGLLDVVVAPDFAGTGEIFLTYSEPGPDGAGTTAARARLLREDGNVRLADVKVIARMETRTPGGRHFGSRVVPAPDGSVYVTTGDRGQAERAQDPFDRAGSVLRVTRDGGIPADNPHANGETALPEMWSTGHRNIQGAAIEPETGALWTVEHGARGGDEINRPKAGRNYGWPVISYGRHYSGGEIGVGTSAEGYEQPLHYWDPSIAPSGMAFYTGDAIPAWTGDLFVGALKDQLVSRLEVEAGEVTGEERLIVGDYGRIRTLRNGPDGALWFSTDEAGGALYRISAAP